MTTSVTLDANEQYADLAALCALIDRLDRDAALQADRGAAALYRAADAARRPRRHRRSARSAAAISSSTRPTTAYDAFPRGRALGYRGISSKSCKGIYKSILNATRAAKWSAAGRRVLHQRRRPDLPGRARRAAGPRARSRLIGVTHAERNGHHYVDGFGDTPAAEARGVPVRASRSLHERRRQGPPRHPRRRSADGIADRTRVLPRRVHPDWSAMSPLARSTTKDLQEQAA